MKIYKLMIYELTDFRGLFVFLKLKDDFVGILIWVNKD